LGFEGLAADFVGARLAEGFLVQESFAQGFPWSAALHLQHLLVLFSVVLVSIEPIINLHEQEAQNPLDLVSLKVTHLIAIRLSELIVHLYIITFLMRHLILITYTSKAFFTLLSKNVNGNVSTLELSTSRIIILSDPECHPAFPRFPDVTAFL